MYAEPPRYASMKRMRRTLPFVEKIAFNAKIRLSDL